MNNIAAPYGLCQILLSKKTQKFLRSVSAKQRVQFFEKLDLLIKGSPLLDIKKLQGYQFLYRLRVGEYRIVFEPNLQKRVVYIVIIAHRKEVYEGLSRLKTLDDVF